MLQVCSAGKCVILLCSTALTLAFGCLLFPSLAMASFAYNKRWCLSTLVALTGHVNMPCYTRNQISAAFYSCQVCKQLFPYARENIWHSKDSAAQRGYFPQKFCFLSFYTKSVQVRAKHLSEVYESFSLLMQLRKLSTPTLFQREMNLLFLNATKVFLSGLYCSCKLLCKVKGGPKNGF